MEPLAKKFKTSEEENGVSDFEWTDNGCESDFEKLFEKLSFSSLKVLFIDSVKYHPRLLLKAHRLADSEANMLQYLNERVKKLNTEINRCTRVEVDTLLLAEPNAWWKNSESLEAYVRQLESREENEALNTALVEFSAFIASEFAACSKILEKGNTKLAQFCAEQLIRLYTESSANKDGMLNLEEESALIKSLISFHASFVLGISTTDQMSVELTEKLRWLVSNVIHPQIQEMLQTHLQKRNS